MLQRQFSSGAFNYEKLNLKYGCRENQILSDIEEEMQDQVKESLQYSLSS